MKTTNGLRVRIIVLAAVFCCMAATASCGQGTLDDARKLMDGGQYRLSEAVFEALVQRNGQNADAWYWWGVCRLKQGQVADQLFLKAVGLEPSKYSTMIGKAYQQEAEAFLAQGKTNTARNLFDCAVSWDKALKPVIGRNLFNLGHYDLTVRYAPEYRATIADSFYAKGEALDGKDCLLYYRKAKKYSARHNEAIKEKLLAIAAACFEEKDIQFWRNAAAEFGEIPPDFKIYQPGTYTFSLKAGEKTDHWIMFPVGMLLGLNISSSDYKYQLLYDDGEVIKDGENVVLPHKTRQKFKLIAITDQPKITMVVKDNRLSRK